jgi:hypothetical protein
MKLQTSFVGETECSYVEHARQHDRHAVMEPADEGLCVGRHHSFQDLHRDGCPSVGLYRRRRLWDRTAWGEQKCLDPSPLGFLGAIHGLLSPSGTFPLSHRAGKTRWAVWSRLAASWACWMSSSLERQQSRPSGDFPDGEGGLRAIRSRSLLVPSLVRYLPRGDPGWPLPPAGAGLRPQ